MTPLTGRKVAVIAAGLFALVLTPNIILAVAAVTSFTGLVVPNSYIASQEFDARRAAQEDLGWRLDLGHRDGAVRLGFRDAAGHPVRPARLAVTVGRPSTAAADRALALEPTPAGFAAEAALGPGTWLVMIDAEAADGTRWTQRRPLVVPSAP